MHPTPTFYYFFFFVIDYAQTDCIASSTAALLHLLAAESVSLDLLAAESVYLDGD